MPSGTSPDGCAGAGAAVCGSVSRLRRGLLRVARFVPFGDGRQRDHRLPGRFKISSRSVMKLRHRLHELLGFGKAVAFPSARRKTEPPRPAPCEAPHRTSNARAKRRIPGVFAPWSSSALPLPLRVRRAQAPVFKEHVRQMPRRAIAGINCGSIECARPAC